MDSVARARITAVVDGRFSYPDAKEVNGLIDGALSALDGLQKYGVSLVLAVADPAKDVAMDAALAQAHPSRQAVAKYPMWVYHNEQPALIVNDDGEASELGEGWKDANGAPVGPPRPVTHTQMPGSEYA